MAGHPQTTPRGLIAATALLVDGNAIDSDSTGNITLPAGITLGGLQTLNANSTGYVLATAAALPTTRVVGGLVIVSNSTGKALAFHQTGVTWVYANVTSVQPS